MEHLEQKLKQELEGSAVILQNVSSQRGSATDIALLCELMKLTFFTKPPHSIILIIGDRDYSKVLSFLESVHFRVTLVHNTQISDTLRFSVRDIVRWHDVLGLSDQVSSPEQKPKKFSLTKAGKNTSPSSDLPASLSGSSSSSNTTFASNPKNASLALSLAESGSTLPDEFVSLVEYLQSHDSGSQTLSNIEEALQSSFLEFGFKSFADFMSSAERSGVVVHEIHGGGKKIARLHNYGKEYFSKLIEYLQSSYDDAVLFSKIGEECINKKILADHGFSHLRPYIEKAARCGIVKIILNDHGHRLAQLRPNYTTNAKSTHLPSKFSLKVHVPKNKRGLLIGPNGTNVLKLEKELKVKLTLRDPYCFVSTDDEQLAEKAVAFLTSAYRGQIESDQVNRSNKSIRFQVPGTVAEQFKGRKGSLSCELEEQLGVDVDISKLKNEGNGMVSITIIGEEQAILQAKERVLAFVEKNGVELRNSFNYKHERKSSSFSSTSTSTEPENGLEQDIPLVGENTMSSVNYPPAKTLQSQFRTDMLPQRLDAPFSRHSSSEDSIGNGARSLDSDQTTLSRSPHSSEIQAEQEALIPSFLLGNDPDDSPSPPQISKGKDAAAAKLLVQRQKAVLSSFMKSQEEHSRLASYVKE